MEQLGVNKLFRIVIFLLLSSCLESEKKAKDKVEKEVICKDFTPLVVFNFKETLKQGTIIYTEVFFEDKIYKKVFDTLKKTASYILFSDSLSSKYVYKINIINKHNDTIERRKLSGIVFGSRMTADGKLCELKFFTLDDKIKKTDLNLW